MLATIITTVLHLFLAFSAEPVSVETFASPIDAVSVEFSEKNARAEVSAKLQDGSWGAWQELIVDDEQDPELLESNLVLFESAVTEIRFRGSATTVVHPISISSEPSRVLVAATNGVGSAPHILSRSEWGADESFLFVNGQPAATVEEIGDNGDTSSGSSGAVNSRVQKCLDDQFNFPQEFKTNGKAVKTENGKTLRWTRTYSKSVELLVVHHTAMLVTGDDRSGEERMRALYAYHANNRGWGDIGYNYVIDDDGKIYEGRSGGDSVVAGHAYCNNVGTIGISLMGNFEEEEPTQDQVRSLQWLLANLGDRYDVDTGGTVTFHGTTRPTIVGHRDVISTSCPGFYMYGAMDQVRDNVADGDLTAMVSFPQKEKISSKPRVNGAEERKAERLKKIPAKSAFTEGITVTGGSTLAGRGGSQMLFTLRYQANSNGAKRGQNVGTITRGNDDIGLWMDKDGAFVRVRNDIELPQAVPPEGQLLLRMRVQMPREQGTHSLRIGDSQITLQVTGRSLESKGQPATPQTATRSSSARPIVVRSSSSARSFASKPTVSTSPTIRIRLLSREGGLLTCRDADLTALLSLYRGSVNCEVVDGKPVLINTISLEEYMMGLAEEPDTEPYEKQRAFAIAARTYALWYTDPAYRKFPGKPYDGSDSAAEFQKYTGRTFETKNPRWLTAVQSTKNLVLTKDGQVIKPPYFSSDDGRTRAPSEVGWGTFPFKEIFSSKPDPWCEGMENRGHGVGMSGCGAEGQANEGKTAEEILEYYYPGTALTVK